MTDAGWAERVARKVQLRIPGHGPEPLVQVTTVATLLKAEHARSVRMVKAEIKRVQLDERNYGISEQILLIAVLEKLLAKLQRGRGGKG